MVLVPAADTLVETWRNPHDPSRALGMPAHITILFPFLQQDDLSTASLEALRAICRGTRPLQTCFRDIGRFPSVLYLEPRPAVAFVSLTAAIETEWPDHPPFAGEFDEVIPHLTVTNGASEEVMDAAADDLSTRLPLSVTLTEASLFVFDGDRWQLATRLPFGDT